MDPVSPRLRRRLEHNQQWTCNRCFASACLEGETLGCIAKYSWPLSCSKLQRGTAIDTTWGVCTSFRISQSEHHLREDADAQGRYWNGTGRVLEPCEAKADGGKLRLKQVCGTGEENWGRDRDSVGQEIVQHVTEVALLQLVEAVRLQTGQSHSVNLTDLKSIDHTSCLGTRPSARLAYADTKLARSAALSHI